MATFLDKKEQVLDIQLTSHGKYLLSAGKFKPMYYSFLDNNIIYDYKHAGIFENQKDIHDRITQHTPYLQTQVAFDSPEERLKEKIEKIRGKIPLFFNETNDMGIEKELSHNNIDRRSYVLNNTIGSSPASVRRPPAWDIKLLKGSISGSSPHIIEPYELISIPQLDIEVNYQVKNLSIHSRTDMAEADVFKEFFEEDFYMADMQKTETFNNDTFLQVFPEDPIIDIKELNADFEVENFEIEVFKVEPTYNRKISGNEKLVKLKFVKEKEEIINGILIDDDGYDPASAPITVDNVEYYFNIEIDSNIDNKQLCSAVNELRSDNYFIDIPIECDDEIRARMDIYGPSGADPEVCD